MTIELPNYRIIEKLGVGAQTQIFRARCMRTGRDYAVKIVKIHGPEDTAIVDLLKTEHEIGSSVDHPAVRKVFELRMVRQRLRTRGAVLFMEYVAGAPLSEKDLRPVDQVLDFMIQAAHGLHAMHMAGYVHADLKPENLLITPENRVKVIDLGQSAKAYEAKTRIQGTIHYIAPEQVERRPLDARTDVFGLGATLHRVLTGRAIQTMMNQTVNMHSQSLVGRRVGEIARDATDQLPLPLARLIIDCCAMDPAERLSDMPALIARLELVQTILSRDAAAASGDAADLPLHGLDELHLDDTLSGDDSFEFDALFDPPDAPEKA